MFKKLKVCIVDDRFHVKGRNGTWRLKSNEAKQIKGVYHVEIHRVDIGGPAKVWVSWDIVVEIVNKDGSRLVKS